MPNQTASSDRADDLDHKREAHDPAGEKHGLLDRERRCAVFQQELVAQGVGAGAAPQHLQQNAGADDEPETPGLGQAEHNDLPPPVPVLQRIDDGQPGDRCCGD